MATRHTATVNIPCTGVWLHLQEALYILNVSAKKLNRKIAVGML